MKSRQLRTFQLRNFKAVRDSGRITFGGLTVFIGNNGSGKSSIVEGLETFRDIVLDGLDATMHRWRGLEYVWNQSVRREVRRTPEGRLYQTRPLGFRLGLVQEDRRVGLIQQVTLGPGGNELLLLREKVMTKTGRKKARLHRKANGAVVNEDEPEKAGFAVSGGETMLRPFIYDVIKNWQFLSLAPDAMGQPQLENRAADRSRLRRNGSNVAEYLDDIRRQDPNAFNGILESLQVVLPYATDLRPTLASELGRSFYLKLTEGDFDVPGWLISTGTLRIVALLACLRHPSPPSLLIVEEVENGLDPRTLHLLVEEIGVATALGRTQVILTTHSPYLLDLLDLRHIIVVEREGGQPAFRRPDARQLAEWSKSFSPGQLYTMGHLTKGRA